MDNQTKEQLFIQNIIVELSECREDERASRNQIFAILAAVATFLTVVVTAVTYMLSQDGGIRFFMESSMLKTIMNGLSTFVVCAAIGYITNLGILSTFRHYYLMEMEHILNLKISEDKGNFYHWESISTPLITLNIKHVSGWPSVLYCFNFYESFFSILMLAVMYIFLCIR